MGYDNEVLIRVGKKCRRGREEVGAQGFWGDVCADRHRIKR